MAAGKTSYEETLGLMTAITEITRDANSAALVWKYDLLPYKDNA